MALLNGMRYLGIDYGHKKIGIAVSDEEGRIAFPLVELPAEFGGFVKEIKKIIKKKSIQKIIIGLPVTFSGKESFQTRAVREFGCELERVVQLPVEYENEVLSTKLAERGGTPQKMINAASAAIILQSYLDKKS